MRNITLEILKTFDIYFIHFDKNQKKLHLFTAYNFKPIRRTNLRLEVKYKHIT